MTASADEVASWIEPYVADFRELLRQLDRVPDFIFQPVVLPSPDLARALADWLATQGVAVRAFDMRHEPWDDLAARLLGITFAPAEVRRAIVVITPLELDHETVRDGFLALNSVRDTLARTLQCPMLWCGGVDLLRTTANFATDFWSIAATVYRIPPRAFDSVARGLSPHLWYTGAVNESVETLREQVTRAREAGAYAATRASLQLAEALVLRGERTEAREVLESVADTVLRRTPSLVTRWSMLRKATIVDRDREIQTLRTEIAAHVARGARRMEAWSRLKLASLLVESDAPKDFTTARDQALLARTIHMDLGDEASVVSIDLSLVLDTRFALSAEQQALLFDHAARVRRDATLAPIHPLASVVLAELCASQQRFDEAEAHARDARAAVGDRWPNFLSVPIVTVELIVAMSRDDWPALNRVAGEYIEVLRAEDHPGYVDGYLVRAIALDGMHRWRESLQALQTAADLARRYHRAERYIMYVCRASAIAEHAQASEVARALAARAFAAFVASGRLADLALPLDETELRARGDLELADLVEAWRSGESQERVRERTRALADARENALIARGVDLDDPDTWPLAPPPDPPREGPAVPR